MKKIKILHIHPHDTLISNLFSDSEHFVVDVVHIESHMCSQFLRKSFNSVFYFPRINKRPFTWMIKLIRLLISNKYDYIHCHIGRLSFLPAIINWLFFNYKFIAHIHELSPSDNAYKRFIVYLLDYLSFKLAACSQKSGEIFYKNKNFIIFPNFVDYKKFTFSQNRYLDLRKHFKIPKDSYILGNVGMFSLNKNQLFLVKLLSELNKLSKNYFLFLIGDGFTDEIMELSIELNVYEHIKILPFQYNIEDYYSLFDIFLFPSFKEGFGMSLLEAQISGLSCIANIDLPKDACVSNNVSFRQLDLKIWLSEIIKLSKRNFDRSNLSINDSYDVSRKDKFLLEFYGL